MKNKEIEFFLKELRKGHSLEFAKIEVELKFQKLTQREVRHLNKIYKMYLECLDAKYIYEKKSKELDDFLRILKE